MMKAIVWHGIGDIRLDTVREPSTEEDTDAIVRLTASAICGTDLHFFALPQRDEDRHHPRP